MRNWYIRVFHLYLCGVVMYHVIFDISFLLANAAGQHIASPIASPLANPMVVGIGILFLARLLIMSLLRTDWEAFRRFTLILLVSHAATSIAYDVALSLTAGFSILNAVVWSFFPFSHLINSSPPTTTPILSRSHLSSPHSPASPNSCATTSSHIQTSRR